jgi:hypothetical protein
VKIGDIVRHVNGTGLAIVRTVETGPYEDRVCITKQSDGKEMWLDSDDLEVVRECNVKMLSEAKTKNGEDVVIISVFGYKSFKCKYRASGTITTIFSTGLLKINGEPIYSDEIKENKSMNLTKPETQSQKTACNEAIQDAVAAKLAEDKKQYTAGMAEYIKVETERRKFEAQAKSLEETLGITDEIKAKLF